MDLRPGKCMSAAKGDAGGKSFQGCGFGAVARKHQRPGAAKLAITKPGCKQSVDILFGGKPAHIKEVRGGG